MVPTPHTPASSNIPTMHAGTSIPNSSSQPAVSSPGNLPRRLFFPPPWVGPEELEFRAGVPGTYPLLPPTSWGCFSDSKLPGTCSKTCFLLCSSHFSSWHVDTSTHTSCFCMAQVLPAKAFAAKPMQCSLYRSLEKASVPTDHCTVSLRVGRADLCQVGVFLFFFVWLVG